MRISQRGSALALRARTTVGLALIYILFAACGAGSLSVYAQQAAATAPQESAPATVPAPPCLAGSTTPQCGTSESALRLETIVITGTLIARPAAETAEAITVVKADVLKSEGIVNVEQAVDQLTSNVPGINVASSVTSYSGGGSYANLRDLGASKTLVLLDGQRLADNVVLGNSVDLNGIPFGAIQEVQVLREGASSLYGSDAIGGVINFITKKNYQGGEINLDLSRPQEAGGGSGEADFTFGHGDLLTDGYNLLITGSYSGQQELTASQRSFAATGFNPSQNLENVNGPTAPFPASYTDANGNLWQADYPACTGNTELARYQGACEYLYSAAVDLLPKSAEASVMAEFTKQLAGDNTVALQYFRTLSDVTQWFGPISYSFTMNPGDPYFPTAAGSTCITNVSTSGPCTGAPDLGAPIQVGWTPPYDNRFNKNVNTEQRVLLTFDGRAKGWNYAADFDYSSNADSQDVIGGGQVDYAMIAPGNVISPLINPFGPLSQAGQNLINSATFNGTLATGKLQHYDVGGHASHELGDAFGSGQPATLALGFQVSHDTINYDSTPLAVILQPSTGFPLEDVSGSRNAQAIYTELDVPMSKSLDVDISDREDRFSDFGNTNNGKLSLRYQAARFLTLRGAASTGFRAPSLVNLYAPDVFGYTDTMQGPGCLAGNYTTIFSAVNCISQGLSLSGGNAKLEPETSENFDFGVIIEPIANMGITVDYYRILVKNEIQPIQGSAIYSNPSQFANLYVLNNEGTLTPGPNENSQCVPYTSPTCGYIIQTTQNTGGITTDGLDLSMQYLVRTPVGSLHADLEGTAITHFRLQEYTGGPQVDLLGWFNGNQPAIRWQHTLTLMWLNPSGKVSAGITNRFLSSYIDQSPDGAANQRTVASQSTWDVYASYKPIVPLTVLFGIHNLLATTPPFSNQSLNWQAGYNPIYSSPLLRTFYLNLKYEF